MTATNHKRNKMKLSPCSCGGEAEFVKLVSNRYQGFIKCSLCGKETELYASKQNAAKAWAKINRVPEAKENLLEAQKDDENVEGC